jgi:spermidine synthase
MLYLALACSGAAALIYEVAWTRQLGLVMGHTVAAATAVLAAFMGGMAAGAVLAGRVAPRLTRVQALYAYAALEATVAIFAIALPLEIRWLESPLAWAYRDGDGGVLFAAVRLLSAVAAVAMPAIAMGATLPMLVRWQVTSAAAAGSETGRLYAANTGGAALGTALTGFVLLPALGIAATTRIGIVLNIVAAAVAIVLSRAGAPTPVGESTSIDGRSSRPRPTAHFALAPLRGGDARAAIAAVAASGAASMLLQLAWTRVLALAIGPTTYAFSAMVTAFIAGIAIGSAVGSMLARRAVSATAPAAALLVAGAAVLLAGLAAERLPLLIAGIVGAPDASFANVVWRQTLTIAAVMLPMTVAVGAVWPLAVAESIRDADGAAADVGRLYGVNSAAAVAGALLAGLWLIPHWGLEVTIRVAAVVLVATAAGIVVMGRTSRFGRTVVAAGAVTVAVAAVFLPRWDRALVASGAYKYAAYMPAEYREPMLRAGRLLYYKEGAAATVTVRRVAGTTSLAIDGKVDASDAGDMLTQKLLAHAPMLLHPQARRVGIIGLGSGVTLASALTHPIERADVIEISPEVVAASASFEHELRGALRDPRTRLLVSDGRTHVRLSRAQYDVLISEPSNPWMAGIAALFTREFFAAARARLAPGGLLCQWAHTYDITDADLRSIVATFTAVFPHAQLWQVGDGDILLIGADAPLQPRIDAARRAWPAAIAADLHAVGVTSPDVLLSNIAGDTAALRRYGSGAAVQTDDRLGLEFSGPRGIYGASATDRAMPVSDSAGNGPPGTRPEISSARGVMLLRAEAYGQAFAEFSRAIERDPGDQVAADGLLDAAPSAGRVPDALALLERLQALSKDVAVAVALSRLRAFRGDFDGARAPVERLALTEPSERALDQLASIAADAGGDVALAAHVKALERSFPGSEAAVYYASTLAAMRGDIDRAWRGAEALAARGSARGINLLASLAASRRRPDEAREALQRSLAINPRDVAVYEALGTLELRLGRAAEARDAFAEALTLAPASPGAREGLAAAMNALKK